MNIVPRKNYNISFPCVIVMISVIMLLQMYVDSPDTDWLLHSPNLMSVELGAWCMPSDWLA